MINARMLGFNVRKIMEKENKTVSDLSKVLNCSEHDFDRFLMGRAILSYKQIKTLAENLNITVFELLNGNEEEYYKYAVQCYGEFEDIKNREKILNIIDGYMDIVEVTKLSKPNHEKETKKWNLQELK